MTAGTVLGASLMAIAVVLLALGVAGIDRRANQASETTREYFAPRQRHRYLFSALFPVVLGFFALTADPGDVEPLGFGFWLLLTGLVLTLLALLAIVWTGGDFVAIDEDSLRWRQGRTRHDIPWIHVHGVVARGPFQLVVQVTDEGRFLQQTWLQRQIVKLLRAPNFFINTVPLEVDSSEIQNAIAGARESWEGRRPS